MFARIIVSVQKNIIGGPQFGTEYDLTNSCPQCGSGAVPKGPRFLKLKRVPKQPVFQTLDREILLSTKVADALRSIGERFLAEVRDADTKEPLPLWELRAEAELPNFAKTTTGFETERSCEHCHRDGYFGIPHTPLRLVYPTSVFPLADVHVLGTYERFGNSRLRTPFEKSVFARPLYLVSDEIQNTIVELGIPGVSFESIYLECVLSAELHDSM